MGLTAYLDESGTHGTSPALIFGGAIAKKSAWSRCERELRSLFEQYDIEAFHAIDFRPPRGSFKGWSQFRLQAFVQEFVALIFKRAAYCITVACKPADYAEVYKGANPPRKPRKDTLYGLCFRVTMVAMIDFISDKQWRWPLDVVLEHGHKHSGDAVRIFDELKKATPPGMLGEMVLKRKKDCELLAIPDALVHSIFKIKTGNPVVTPAVVRHEVTIEEAVPREPTFQARFHTFNLTRDSLSQLVDSLMASSAKEPPHMARTPQPTDEELLGHHLAYEIDQMVASLTMLGRVEVPNGLDPKQHWQQALNNALMESFYVHARALFEFFKKARGAQRYAVSGYQPFKGADPEDWVQRLNNQASHLLDGRTANDSLKINGKERFEMLDALRTEVEAFKKAIRPEFSHITIPSIPPASVRVAGGPGATGVFGEIKDGA